MVAYFLSVFGSVVLAGFLIVGYFSSLDTLFFRAYGFLTTVGGVLDSVDCFNGFFLMIVGGVFDDGIDVVLFFRAAEGDAWGFGADGVVLPILVFFVAKAGPSFVGIFFKPVLGVDADPAGGRLLPEGTLEILEGTLVAYFVRAGDTVEGGFAFGGVFLTAVVCCLFSSLLSLS